MKKTVLAVFAVLAAITAFAQDYYTHYQSKTEPQTLLANINCRNAARREIILPNVGGYSAYAVDLHVHSIYSDGVMRYTGRGRIHEAWCDGMHAIAVTDHMGIKVYSDKDGEVTPNDVKAKKGNRPQQAIAEAGKVADDYGMLIIPGVEITGTPKTLGHFNALFTTDNKTVFDYNPIQNIRNAREQGALIMHNHPGWRQSTLEMTQFVKDVYGEKLVDGVEIMNGYYFYPRAIDVAKEHKLFVAATTDIHGTTAELYRENNHLRNMTIVFAKELSLEAIRQGLESRRTLAYSFGVLSGEEKLLNDFFKASVETKKLNVSKKNSKSQRVMLTNKTSLPFTLQFGKGNPVVLPPLSSIIVSTRVGKPVQGKVLSMWCGMDEHPTFSLKY